MTLPTFGQLLSEYMQRSGISDSELARSIGVRRQTVFRWKEGLVERPRAREDVLQCAKKLRLTDVERDRLLLAAGFAPEQLAPGVLHATVSDQAFVAQTGPSPMAIASDSEPDQAMDDAPAEDATLPTAASSAIEPIGVVNTPVDDSVIAEESLDSLLMPLSTTSASLVESEAPTPTASTSTASTASTSTVSTPTASTSSLAPPLPSLPPLLIQLLHLLADRRLRWWPAGAGLLLVLLLALLWTRSTPFLVTPTPLPPVTVPPVTVPPATVELHAPPQTTPVNLGDYPIAAEGETLLLVAQFRNYTLDTPYNVAGRISEELGQQIAAAGLISTTVINWPEEITNVLRARQLLTAANATLVIWGEYDQGRVRVNLEARDPQANQSRNFTPTPADELVTTINAIVPVEIRNTALLALGTLAKDQGQYQMTVGRLLRDQGNYQAAAILFERALELKPEDPTTAANLHFYLGYLAEKTESIADYDRAIAYYTRAFALNTQLVNALYNRGTVQIWRSRLLPASEPLILDSLNAAIDDLTKVIAQRPGYLNAYLNRAIAYYERDNPADMLAALTDLNHVIAIKPDYTNAYFNRGLVYMRTGAGLQWVGDFQQTLALDPKYTGAISGLCWGYALAQQPAKALSYCNQAVILDQKGTSNDSRGIVYAQLGRYPDAIADFRIYLDSLQKEQAVTLYERYRGPLVEEWIAQLEAAKNPFDRALLERLRHRDHY